MSKNDCLNSSFAVFGAIFGNKRNHFLSLFESRLLFRAEMNNWKPPIIFKILPSNFAERDSSHGGRDVLVDDPSVLQPFVEILSSHFSRRCSAELRECFPSEIY